MLRVSAVYASIEEEFEDSLCKAFVVNRADFIRVDDRRKEFQVRSALFGQSKGWLALELIEVDEQYSYYKGTLTSAGKEHFGCALQT